MRSEEAKKRSHAFPRDQRPLSQKTSHQASKQVTRARASAQRATLETQARARKHRAAEVTRLKSSQKQTDRRRLLANRRASTTLIQAIEDYLLDHESGNHSPKTLEWHRTALGLNTFQLRAKTSSWLELGRGKRISMSTKSSKRSWGRNGSGGGIPRFLGLCLL